MDAHWHKTDIRGWFCLLNLKWKSRLAHLTVKITVALPSSVVLTPSYLVLGCFLLCFHENSDAKTWAKAGMGTQQHRDAGPTARHDEMCHCIAKTCHILHRVRPGWPHRHLEKWQEMTCQGEGWGAPQLTPALCILFCTSVRVKRPHLK